MSEWHPGPMREPILPSQNCPEQLQPQNCRLARIAAEANGWQTACKIAIGYPGDGEPAMRSVMLYAKRAETLVVAMWGGDVDGSKMGYDGAWEYPGAWQLSYAELGHLLKGTEPKPTKKQAEADQAQTASMLSTMNLLKRLGWPVAVLPTGTSATPCKGKVDVGGGTGVVLWAHCANTAARGGVLCAGPCGPGLIADL